jgi:hypothetical protein
MLNKIKNAWLLMVGAIIVGVFFKDKIIAQIKKVSPTLGDKLSNSEVVVPPPTQTKR